MIRLKSTGSCLALLFVAAIMVAAPAKAEDTEKGLLLGLGLTAATGKSTLGENAGVIEAGLLNQEALQQAGAIIAMVANATKSSASKPILLLGRTDMLDVGLPDMLARNLTYIRKRVVLACPRARPAKPEDRTLEAMLDDLGETTESTGDGNFLNRIKGADLVGAALVDRSVAGITLMAEDRSLVNAVLMNAKQKPLVYASSPNSWNTWPPTENEPIAYTPRAPVGEVPPGMTAETAAAPYRIWGESFEPGKESAVLKAYEALSAAATDLKGDCPAAGKGWIERAEALLASAVSTEKGPSQLATAMQTEQLMVDRPLILRVGIDQVGGTSISRSGIIYALGWPNAMTVASGLGASFRLIDPAKIQPLRQGVIRCMVRQTNLRRVSDMLEHRAYRKTLTQRTRLGDTVCDFRVAVTG